MVITGREASFITTDLTLKVPISLTVSRSGIGDPKVKTVTTGSLKVITSFVTSRTGVNQPKLDELRRSVAEPDSWQLFQDWIFSIRLCNGEDNAEDVSLGTENAVWLRVVFSPSSDIKRVHRHLSLEVITNFLLDTLEEGYVSIEETWPLVPVRQRSGGTRKEGPKGLLALVVKDLVFVSLIRSGGDRRDVTLSVEDLLPDRVENTRFVADCTSGNLISNQGISRRVEGSIGEGISEGTAMVTKIGTVAESGT